MNRQMLTAKRTAACAQLLCYEKPAEVGDIGFCRLSIFNFQQH